MSLVRIHSGFKFRNWIKRSIAKHRQFPRPFEAVALHSGKKELCGAEVGVLGGKHAASILKYAPVKLLYLIDPYEAYADYDHTELGRALPEAEKRLKGKSVHWMKMTSERAAECLNEKELDFVYLDGAHDYESVRHDIALWWPRVQRGGVLGGHDFSDGLEYYGVIPAVCEFVVRNNLRLHVQAPLCHSACDWWIEKV